MTVGEVVLATAEATVVVVVVVETTVIGAISAVTIVVEPSTVPTASSSPRHATVIIESSASRTSTPHTLMSVTSFRPARGRNDRLTRHAEPPGSKFPPETTTDLVN
jgi:hypothetical protein